MGLPATIAQPTMPCSAHDLSPYRFGSFAPSTLVPHPGHYPSQDWNREVQTLRNAATYWNIPNIMYSVVGLPTLPSGTSGATAYPYPPFQLPYQQHAAPPLSAIHNTRCAQAPSSPSVMSTMSTDTDNSPQCSPVPSFIHVVCNAPLVAPVPLPYHSPTFLQFDLPDDDEDLSHPPYVSRPHKRKRSEEDGLEEESARPVGMRRRVTQDRSTRWAVHAPYSRYRPSAASHAAPAASIGSYRHR